MAISETKQIQCGVHINKVINRDVKELEKNPKKSY